MNVLFLSDDDADFKHFMVKKNQSVPFYTETVQFSLLGDKSSTKTALNRGQTRIVVMIIKKSHPT
jgi:hypothetical protein